MSIFDEFESAKQEYFKTLLKFKEVSKCYIDYYEIAFSLDDFFNELMDGDFHSITALKVKDDRFILEYNVSRFPGDENFVELSIPIDFFNNCEDGKINPKYKQYLDNLKTELQDITFRVNAIDHDILKHDGIIRQSILKADKNILTYRRNIISNLQKEKVALKSRRHEILKTV